MDTPRGAGASIRRGGNQRIYLVNQLVSNPWGHPADTGFTIMTDLDVGKLLLEMSLQLVKDHTRAVFGVVQQPNYFAIEGA